MKVNYTETIKHEININIVDIDVMSEEERLLLLSRFYKIDSYKVASRYYLYCSTDHISKRKNTLFYVFATLTLSGSELPVGSTFHIPGPLPSEWSVIKENKASGVTCFEADEYTEDEAKLKAMLRKWAENNGIVFGE